MMNNFLNFIKNPRLLNERIMDILAHFPFKVFGEPLLAQAYGTSRLYNNSVKEAQELINQNVEVGGEIPKPKAPSASTNKAQAINAQQASQLPKSPELSAVNPRLSADLAPDPLAGYVEHAPKSKQPKKDAPSHKKHSTKPRNFAEHIKLERNKNTTNGKSR